MWIITRNNKNYARIKRDPTLYERLANTVKSSTILAEANHVFSFLPLPIDLFVLTSLCRYYQYNGGATIQQFEPNAAQNRLDTDNQFAQTLTIVSTEDLLHLGTK